MKKIYEKPTMTVVRLQQMGIICQSVTSTSTNLDPEDNITIGGGGNGPSRARSFGGFDWDDWDEE